MARRAGTGATHGFYTMDATKKEDIDAAFAKAASELGAVSVLVYNISDSPKTLMTKVLDDETFERHRDFIMNRKAAPAASG